ncbi:MAG: methyltransferase domain-containing protein [Spirochaetes bacterium]|nr:methyltransferase domain-containing protein [Spirochaetota bacterium]MBU1079785.1 methyltransferase domain-containing protein [Spirochaetota bacterium]
MDILGDRLGRLRPGRVLELATGGGGFALTLASRLGSYGELVATDSSERAVTAAASALEGLRGVRVEIADARALPYADASFDLVAVANSLHHFEDPSRVVAEALRVLRPGGALVVFEMHREAATEPELNHARLHRFWGRVDSAGGVYHAETFDRARFRSLLGLPAFAESSWDEVPGPEGDPKDPELLAEVERTFVMYRGRIAALKDPGLRARLVDEADAVEALVRERGFRSAPSVLFVGRAIARDGGTPC